MISLIKKGAFVLLAFFAFNTANAQPPSKLLSIDSLAQLEPITMFDSTNFAVTVGVYDSTFLTPDSIFGDLIFYFWTDSMDSAGVPPRVINNIPGSNWIIGSVTEILSIDIRPDEIRTSPPVNLIILWPAIIGPELPDTVPDTLYFDGVDGYLVIPQLPDQKRHNIVFPVPAMQFMYIKKEEIDLIAQINILSIEGKMISTHEYLEYKSGFIHIDTLPTGTYLIELNYKNGATIRTKMIKN